MYEKLIERLHWTEKNDERVFDAETAKFAGEVIKKLVAENDELKKKIVCWHEDTQRNSWISAEYEVPVDDSFVLVVVSGRYELINFEDAIELAEYDPDEGWILEAYPDARESDLKVTHWMPLPEPPEGE